MIQRHQAKNIGTLGAKEVAEVDKFVICKTESRLLFCGGVCVVGVGLLTVFNCLLGANHTPTIYLTKGTNRNWLGRPVHPPIQQVSYEWWEYDEDTDFMKAQEAGTNEFQTLFPINIHTTGQNPFTPPNDKVVTTRIHGPTWTEPMMKVVESTLLGPAAGMDEVGRRLVAYQMQMPMKGKGRNKEVDNSMITEVSETLEIVYEGMYTLLAFQKEPVPIDITTTMT